MNQEQWYSIPGFPNYEISSIGNARYLNGKPLRLHQYKGFSLRRNGEQRYIRPARLLYAVSNNIDPTEIRDIVVLDINGKLTPMTRTEYILYINSKRKRGNLNIEEAISYYHKNIEFSQKMLRYYETRDMTEIVNELLEYEHSAKSYMRKMGYSCNDSTTDEAWDCIFHNIINNIYEGRISIIEPRTYILKSIRIYFKRLRKANSRIIRLKDGLHGISNLTNQ